MTPLIIGSIIVFAFFGQAIFGFGGGLIAVPLLSLVVEVRDAVTLVLIFQFLMGILIFSTYKSIAWRQATTLFVGLSLGTIVGTYSLTFFTEGSLRIALSSFIFLFLVKSRLFPHLVLASPTPIGAFLSGGIGGLFQGFFGTGAPNLVIHLRETVQSAKSVRATLIALLFFANALRMALSFPAGLLKSAIWTQALLIIPFFASAIFLGHRVHSKISETNYKLCMDMLLLLSAIALVCKS